MPRRFLTEKRRHVSEHLPFLILFACAAALRVVVSLAYVPALMLQADAYAYLRMAVEGAPGITRPALYPLLFVKPLVATGELALVPAVQHAIALVLAAVLYALLRRWDVGRWLAAAGVAPFLLDTYQLNVEHYLLSEVFFDALVVPAIVVLVWRGAPGAAAVATSGALIGLATVTRFAGIAVAVPALIFVLTRDAGWRRRTLQAIVLTAAIAVPIGVYSAWFTSRHGEGGISDTAGYFLYGRVAAFAECSEIEPPRRLRVYCFREPPSERSRAGHFTLDVERFRDDPDSNEELIEFGRRAIAAQPLGYTSAVVADLGRYFTPAPPPDRERYVRHWRFARTPEEARPDPENVAAIRRWRGSPPAPYDLGRLRIDRGLATFLRSLQAVLYTPGPLLAALLLVAIAGGVTGRVAGERGPRGAALLFAGAALALLLLPVMVTVYHFRYVLPALPLAGPAGALGVHLLLQRRRQTRDGDAGAG